MPLFLSSEDRESFSFELDGISPEVDAGSAQSLPEATPSNYWISIWPAAEATWGETGDSGVRTRIEQIDQATQKTSVGAASPSGQQRIERWQRTLVP